MQSFFANIDQSGYTNRIPIGRLRPRERDPLTGRANPYAGGGPQSAVGGDDGDWTGDVMTFHWLFRVFAFEFLGSMFLFFVGMSQTASPNASPWTQASAFGFTSASIRSLRLGISLNPLDTLAELVLFRKKLSLWRYAKALGSIVSQIVGSIIGTYFALQVRGSVSMQRTFTVPKTDDVGVMSVVVSEFVFTSIIAFCSMKIQYDTIRSWDEATSDPVISSNAVIGTPDAVVAVKKKPAGLLSAIAGALSSVDIEPVATSGVYVLAVTTMAELTGGSFVLTRSLAPAVVLKGVDFACSEYHWVGVYFASQCVGHLMVVIYFLTR
jgi:glycerol uptake facilitator-like aquaporin